MAAGCGISEAIIQHQKLYSLLLLISAGVSAKVFAECVVATASASQTTVITFGTQFLLKRHNRRFHDSARRLSAEVLRHSYVGVISTMRSCQTNGRLGAPIGSDRKRCHRKKHDQHRKQAKCCRPYNRPVNSHFHLLQVPYKFYRVTTTETDAVLFEKDSQLEFARPGPSARLGLEICRSETTRGPRLRG